MTPKKKLVLFIRLPDDIEEKFRIIRTQHAVHQGKPITKNKMIIHLIQERYESLTDPSPRSSETEMAIADEPQTLASELDTPHPETCTSEVHSV